ncbi:MAG: hypothetical protein LBD88_01330 [Candidatus Peribacteria bacterium]|nr:hypothetical protein [Candidatus Peribacteria bacterium]
MLVNVILKSFSSHSFTEVNPFTCNVAVSSTYGLTIIEPVVSPTTLPVLLAFTSLISYV